MFRNGKISFKASPVDIKEDALDTINSFLLNIHEAIYKTIQTEKNKLTDKKLIDSKC